MLLRDGCPELVVAPGSGLSVQGRAETHYKLISLIPSPDAHAGISPETEGFMLLSVHTQHSKVSLKCEGMSIPSSADFWSIPNVAWQTEELLWGVSY